MTTESHLSRNGVRCVFILFYFIFRISSLLPDLSQESYPSIYAFDSDGYTYLFAACIIIFILLVFMGCSFYCYELGHVTLLMELELDYG